ncbi:hypothetical protein M426DRAFT_53358 [Hypoxylon sp. CI-4A]|nr:hypothetical protein M426DRAFT_53358 [Hypoxylon sp. CI-4A]
MAKRPDLHIPPSTSTVNVSIVDSTGSMRGFPVGIFLEPTIDGHEYQAAPCHCFLIQNPRLKRNLVFDLGIRKDHWNWPPRYVELMNSHGVDINVPKDVRDVLEEHGFDAKDIEGVIWSHPHSDHIGNPSVFEPSTALIVGPGVKDDLLPGYPANPEAEVILESDYAGREVRELDFTRSDIKIGKLRAIDYFGDGSFYLLDAPGHSIGHICGFARVTSNPDSFILMAGDAIHHGGMLRPHPWQQLPESILPHPFTPSATAPCPGELFKPLLRGRTDVPFYKPASGCSGKPTAHRDPAETLETIRKLQEFDAHDNIFLVAAHEYYIMGVVDFFPKTANDFAAKGWVQKVRWAFLADYAKAVGHDGKVANAADWAPHPPASRPRLDRRVSSADAARL